MPPVEWLFPAPLPPRAEAVAETEAQTAQRASGQMTNADAEKLLLEETGEEKAAKRAQYWHLLAVIVILMQLAGLLWTASVGSKEVADLTARVAEGRHGPNSFHTVTTWLADNVPATSVVGATLQMAAHVRLVSKNDEFCIKNENSPFKMMSFVFQMTNFAEHEPPWSSAPARRKRQPAPQGDQILPAVWTHVSGADARRGPFSQ